MAPGRLLRDERQPVTVFIEVELLPGIGTPAAQALPEVRRWVPGDEHGRGRGQLGQERQVHMIKVFVRHGDVLAIQHSRTIQMGIIGVRIPCALKYSIF